MIQIVGIIFLFVMVFGGYVVSGGHFAVILEGLPHEMMTIGGAAGAALLLGNSIASGEKTLREGAKVVSGPQRKTSDYRAPLFLLFPLPPTHNMKRMNCPPSRLQR